MIWLISWAGLEALADSESPSKTHGTLLVDRTLEPFQPGSDLSTLISPLEP